jgi:hypothetical protein
MNNPGYIVIRKNGEKGRTYHCKGLIGGKIPVYPFPIENKEAKPILCTPESLKMVGFIN